MAEKQYPIKLEDGRTLFCMELGKASGEAVIYCHGYPGSRLEARLAEQAVKRLGLRLIAADRPGFGQSSFQAGRTIADWPGDIKQLADKLGLERFSLVGVSGGGPYALACAASMPDRLNEVALVAALAPMSGGKPISEMVAFNRMMLGLGARFPALARLTVRLMTHWFRKHPESLFRQMLTDSPEADKQVMQDPVYKAIWLASLNEALGQGGRGVAWELPLLARPWNVNLQQIRIPFRIWHGSSDRVVPVSMAEYLAGSLVHTKLHYLEGEGHFSLIAWHINTVLEDMFR